MPSKYHRRQPTSASSPSPISVEGKSPMSDQETERSQRTVPTSGRPWWRWRAAFSFQTSAIRQQCNDNHGKKAHKKQCQDRSKISWGCKAEDIVPPQRPAVRVISNGSIRIRKRARDTPRTGREIPMCENDLRQRAKSVVESYASWFRERYWRVVLQRQGWP